jgi:Holliday junction resolvasome RuvABC endonuclease subunit
MKLLALDPGDSNFGFSALKFSRQTFKILRCGMLDDTIKEVKEETVLGADAKCFIERFEWLMARVKPDQVAVERYVPRRQGLSNENVNMMIGGVVCHCSKVAILCPLFLAATWKMRLKKFLDIEQIYEGAKPVPVHVVDAVFIGLFTAEKQGHYKLASMTKSRQVKLCRDIKKQFLDLRTGKRKYKPKPKKKKRVSRKSASS